MLACSASGSPPARGRTEWWARVRTNAAPKGFLVALKTWMAGTSPAMTVARLTMRARPSMRLVPVVRGARVDLQRGRQRERRQRGLLHHFLNSWPPLVRFLLRVLGHQR